MAFGVATEINSVRSEQERTQMLKGIYVQVIGLSQVTPDQHKPSV
jgi:hypothetical protein